MLYYNHKLERDFFSTSRKLNLTFPNRGINWHIKTPVFVAVKLINVYLFTLRCTYNKKCVIMRLHCHTYNTSLFTCIVAQFQSDGNNLKSSNQRDKYRGLGADFVPTVLWFKFTIMPYLSGYSGAGRVIRNNNSRGSYKIMPVSARSAEQRAIPDPSCLRH